MMLPRSRAFALPCGGEAPQLLYSTKARAGAGRVCISSTAICFKSPAAMSATLEGGRGGGLRCLFAPPGFWSARIGEPKPATTWCYQACPSHSTTCSVDVRSPDLYFLEVSQPPRYGTGQPREGSNIIPDAGLTQLRSEGLVSGQDTYCIHRDSNRRQFSPGKG